MNIVRAGSHYQIYGEDVKTYYNLPVGSYNIDFHNMKGFFLTTRNDLINTEEKIYGNLEYKVKKVMKSYEIANRNFGVLLSGEKGIGKSLFVRLVAKAAIEKGLPVLIASEAIPGIASFIASIEQDCVVIFDEFEKTFASHDDLDPQTEMLSLFDGIDGGHKLFIVTCNDLEKVSPFMLNRPGRFHYHFELTSPSQDEVRAYLTDKINKEYQSIIEKIVNISGVIDMPYDYLRAIAFEVNQGYDLEEVMDDLNISKINEVEFDITVRLSNGFEYTRWSATIDLNRRTQDWYTLRRYTSSPNDKYPVELRVGFTPCEARIVNGVYVIDKNMFKDTFEPYEFIGSEEETRELADYMNNLTIDHIIFTKVPKYKSSSILV